MNLLNPTSPKRITFFILADAVISVFTLLVSYGLRFNFEIPQAFIHSFFTIFLLLFIIKIVVFSLFNIYMIAWRFFALEDAKKLLLAHLVSYGIFAFIMLQHYEALSPFPRSVIGIDFVLSLFLIGFLRISKRYYLEQGDKSKMKPMLIIGANTKTTQLIKSSLNGEFEYFPSAIVAVRDDEKDAIHTYINGVKVYPLESLQDLVESYKIEAVILTSELDVDTLNSIYENLHGLGVKELHYYNLLNEEKEQFKPVCITDLLARHPKDLDPTKISEFIQGKKVLITGAGGSIGSEIARQCFTFGAKELIFIDHGEYNLYSIKEEIPSAVAKMLSVVDKEALEKVFETYKPDIVIHAAAYKHVPLCEDNVDIALQNNILGTMNVIDTSIKHEVQKLVIISTDKAVRPTNIMGATKRVTELYAQNVESKNSEIVAVRFGNVLDSSGSVIPKFKQQIEQGGPVTVTDAEMTRYFMLIPEACQLVLQASAIAKGNELFILDMGKPVKILDLAKKMIQIYGKENEIKIEFIGLRPGEKLYEELMFDANDTKTKYESIFITKPASYDIDELRRDIRELLTTDKKVQALQKIVPEFKHKA